MAEQSHLKLIAPGVAAWNAWRQENNGRAPDLSRAELKGRDLAGADFSFANLFGADLSAARLVGADFNSANLMYALLQRADLSSADLRQANLFAADLSGAILKEARFSGSHASGVRMTGADLRGANLFVADITRADLSDADLSKSNLFGSLLGGSNLSGAVCRKADFSGADLSGSLLAGVDFTGATLADCKIKGATVTDLQLAGAVQNDLVLTAEGEPLVAVDGIAAALHVTSVINGTALPAAGALEKAALMLGSYPHERKAFLNALREEIRKAGFVPLLFDLANAGGADYSGLVLRLAKLAPFVLVDLGGMETLSREIKELITLAVSPVQLILAGPTTSGITDELDKLAGSASMNELFQTNDQAGMITALVTEVIPRLVP